MAYDSRWTTSVAAVAAIRRPKFVVVDGAQALGHVTEQLGLPYCDMFIAGCHKWLQGHLPMGIGLLPSPKSARRVCNLAVRPWAQWRAR